MFCDIEVFPDSEIEFVGLSGQSNGIPRGTTDEFLLKKLLTYIVQCMFCGFSIDLNDDYDIFFTAHVIDYFY